MENETEINNLVIALDKLLCRHHVGGGHEGHYLECREPACYGARLSLAPYIAAQHSVQRIGCAVCGRVMGNHPYSELQHLYVEPANR